MNIYLKDNLCTAYKLIFTKLIYFFKENNITISKTPDESDVIIVGACGAFNADEERSINMINMFNSYNKPVYVYGCLTKINSEIIKCDKMFFSWEIEKLASTFVKNPNTTWNNFILPDSFYYKSDYRIYNPRKKFINISYGCNYTCSYCPHKIGTGALKSRSIEEIVRQISVFRKKEVDTVVITGIDTSSYGKDIGTNYADMFKLLLQSLDSDINIHIAQFNPQVINDSYAKLINLFSDKRVKDLQFPIQTSSNRLLNLMKRNHDINTVTRFINELKSNNPNLYLRTDLMIGFPTETKEELLDSIRYVGNHFNEVAIYGYESKKGTAIMQMDVEFYSDSKIKERVSFAVNQLNQTDTTVHSGGQDIDSLLKSDLEKENDRMC